MSDPSSGPLRVLLVEDDRADAEIVLLRLADEGFRVDGQRVEDEASYRAALDARPDCILADWTLPQLPGLGALQILRERGLDIPFIVVSARIGEESVVDALRHGAYDFVPKDRLERLGTAVRHALAERRLRDERRADAAALRASEERYRTVIEMADDAIVLLDLEGRILFCNSAYYAGLGLEAGATLSEMGLERLHPDDALQSPTWMQQLRERGSLTTEFRARHEDGHWLFCHARWRVLLNASHQPLALLAIIRDITERKRADEVLRESEELLNSVGEMARVGGWELHVATQKLRWTRETYLIHEVPVGQEPSLADAILFYDLPERTKLENALRRCMEEGEPYDLQLPFTSAKGTQLWTHSVGRAVRVDGAITKLTGTFQDITERVRAAEALRESEARHRGIIEQLNDVYYRTDRDGIITMISPSGAQLFGYPSTGEMIGRPITCLWHDPSQRAGLLATLDERGSVRDYEATAARMDGTLFAVAMSSHLVRDPSGAAAGAEGIIRDITDRKRAEEQLRALAGHLVAVREEDHTRMARELHDEMGQGLTALRLDLSWVARQLPKGSAALRQRVDASIALADEMLAAGQRLVADLRPPILDDLGLVPALEWYVQRFAEYSGIPTTFDLGPAPAPDLMGPLAVAAYRIVQEALTNVARHAHAKQAAVRIAVEDGRLVLEIRDDGRGVPTKALDDPHSFGLVGMRERATSRGGTLQVTGAPRRGTTVRVTIPLQPPEVSER